jgi:hypothetical protein
VKVLVSTIAACAVLAAATATASTVASTPRLFATVGPAGAISLKNAKGTRVANLRARTYTVVVRDRSTRQNFHLVYPDPTLSRKTGLKFVGTVTWKLRLSPGRYRYLSDAKPSLRRSFRVT